MSRFLCFRICSSSTGFNRSYISASSLVASLTAYFAETKGQGLHQEPSSSLFAVLCIFPVLSVSHSVNLYKPSMCVCVCVRA